MDNMLLSLGLYDDPSNQKQDRYDVDLYTSNLAIFGSAMTGKTYLLKWILLNIHYLMKSTEDEEVYILDFSNNLSAFKKLPLVMGYFDSFNEENIRRVFKIVEERYISNVRELPGKNFLQRGSNTKVKHITFVLDGIHVLFADDRYQKYQERLFALARDGLSKGISVIFTATEPVNGIGKMLSSFDHKIAFAINPDSYSNIFFRKVDIPMNKPGRGVANSDGTFVYEFQAFLPYDISDRENSDESVIENMVSRLSQSKYFGIDGINMLLDKHLESIADTLSEKNWNEYVKATKEWMIAEGQKIGKPGHLIAGIDYYLCTPIDINLKEAKTIAIYGKKDSGKTNLLKLILRGLLLSQQDNEHIRIVYWDDTRKGLMDSISGVGNLLSQFIDTKQIENEDEFVKYLCDEKHYCVLEQVEPEKAHTAKLIALPNKRYSVTESEISHKVQSNNYAPLSGGLDDSNFVKINPDTDSASKEEFSSLISNDFNQLINDIAGKTAEGSSNNTSPVNLMDEENETESIEGLQDDTNVEESLDELLDEESETESIEGLQDDKDVEEPLDELLDEESETESIEGLQDDMDVEESFDKLPDDENDTESIEGLQDDMDAEESLDEIPDDENDTESIGGLQNDKDVEESLDELPDYKNDTESIEGLQNDKDVEETLDELPDDESETESIEGLQNDKDVEETLDELPDEESDSEAMERLQDETVAEESLDDLQDENNFYESQNVDTDKIFNNTTSNYQNDNISFEESIEIETALPKESKTTSSDTDGKVIFEDGEFDDEEETSSEFESEPYDGGGTTSSNKETSHETSKSIVTNGGNSNNPGGIINDNPFTVFIIQSRSFFVKAVDSQSHIITRLVNYISECDNVLFVFSDTQSIQDFEVRYHFNNNIRYAFLFDDIVKYIQGKGSRSIFSQYDLDELKENFGRNEKGDAFFYDVLFENIQKIKVILDEQ